VVAVVVAVALAVTCWWLVRGSADPASELTAAPARGLVSASPAVEPVGAPGPSSSGAKPATVTVDVAGKVRHPGIAVLDAGARVVDALEAAGGVKPGVDVSDLNLARLLVDGEQVLVGLPAPAGAAAGAAVPTDAAGPTALVDLNTATEAELDSLPDVGPVTAASILAWRDQHGGFTSVDELLEVDGIGQVTLSKLAPFVTV
jgi:competence protein ComEA